MLKLAKRLFCTAKTPNQGILRDIRILDLSRILAGPLSSMLLSDLGAQVIKIESMDGDQTRKWGPPFIKSDAAYYFSVNRNQKSICVDLQSQQGRQIIYDLAKASDIMIENFSIGVPKKLEMDYEKMQEVNKKIVYASISGYSDKGPLSQYPAFDVLIQGMSGFMHMTGEKSGPPYQLGFAIIDILTGQTLANGILAALYHRQKTGEGMHIRTSLLESALASLTYVSSIGLNSSTQPIRMGNMHPNIVPYGVFPVKNNDFIIIGAGTNNQFIAVCQVLGLGREVFENEKFSSNVQRIQNRNEIQTLISEKLAGYDQKTIISLMRNAKVPCGPIYSIDQIFEDEQVQAIDVVKTIDDQDSYGQIKLVRSALTFNNDENLLGKLQSPPVLNQHSHYVLKNILNYSQEKIDKLQKQKVVQ